MLPLLAALKIDLHAVDYSIMGLYVLFVVGIGFALKRYMKNSSDFLLAGRSIPAWVTGLAFISANLGALEVVGMAASGAKYGMITTHFYGVGAIFAMVFLAIFMMPFYYGSKARSAPEYLKLRFDEKTRGLNAMSFAVMTILGSGISMHALADLLRVLLGWDYNVSLVVSSIVVLLYVLKGGLTSAIYTEVLQFFLIVFGFAPVVYLGLKDIGGWDGLAAKLQGVGQNSQALGLASSNLGEKAWTCMWSPLSSVSANPMGIDVYGLVFGLGFVLAFGYWCTNFLVVQRAMAANSMGAARRTPLIAAVPKMVFPLLVIVPGMIAICLQADKSTNFQIEGKEIKVESAAWPQIYNEAKSCQSDAAAAEKIIAATKIENKAQAFGTKKITEVAAGIRQNKLDQETAYNKTLNAGETDYNNVISSLLHRYCPTGLLGLALTALLASFMSGMAGNVTAFNTVWTYDIYQAYMAKDKSDSHYMWVGRAATVVGIVLSIGFAYVAREFNNVMDLLQLVFGFVNAPIFATFLLGMFWKRATGHGAFWGFACGIVMSGLFQGSTIAKGNLPGVKGAWLTDMLGYNPSHTFVSEMAQNFWLAIFSFTVALVVTMAISLVTKRTKTDEELKGLVYSLTPRVTTENEPWYIRPGIVGMILLAVCIVINIYFW